MTTHHVGLQASVQVGCVVCNRNGMYHCYREVSLYLLLVIQMSMYLIK